MQIKFSKLNLDSVLPLTYNAYVFQKIISHPRIPIIFITILLSIIGFSLYYEYTNPYITMQWSFENEIDVVGFNLHRSSALDGDFVRVNRNLIPSSSDPMLRGEYLFTDYNVQWGITYYYQLESIDRLGKSDWTDPIPLKAQFNPLTR